MSNGPLSREGFKKLLATICDRETSLTPDGWSPENPLLGHCAVVSLIVQNLFGGELLRASLAGTEFAHMRSHYWNRLPDGTAEDFTKTQFGDKYPELQPEVAPRSRALSSPDTVKRYKLLAFRLAKAVSGNNALFEDPIYQRCFAAALDSSCQKMGFGCVITRNGEVVYEGCNKTIAPLKSLCEQRCVRLGIQSRTESMIGACGHAEEGMWAVVHRGIPISECELYIAGVGPDGMPWTKSVAEYTCLRCAVQMHYAQIRAIHVPVVDHWEALTTEYALKTALSYATLEKRL